MTELRAGREELHGRATAPVAPMHTRQPCVLSISAISFQEVEEKLEAELRSGLDECVEEVTTLVAPLGEATAAAVKRLQRAEARRGALAQELEALKQRAAAVE